MNAPRTLAGLSYVTHGPDDAKSIAVLLHGFGAPGTDLVPLGRELGTPDTQFVFPAAPIALGGMYGDARAWWHLDLARLERDLARGIPSERRAEIPEQLAGVRTQLATFLDELMAARPGARLVLGGFSQGAMLSLDVALHRSPPPAALVLMSGTLIAEPVWQPRFGNLAGVPVMLSHGRADGLLPFSMAELLRDKLREGGATVDWQPFQGGHEIPRTVLAAARALLAG